MIDVVHEIASRAAAPAGAPAWGASHGAEPLRVKVASPLGSLGLEFVGRSITRLVIEPEGDEDALFISLGSVRTTDFVDEALGRLSEYFAGARRNLDLPYDLERTGIDALSCRIFQETARIPYGRTRTYRNVATSSGRAGAYRLIRSRLMTNPLPILVPCHRVVPRRSGPGSYIAGEKRKAQLLALERKHAED